MTEPVVAQAAPFAIEVSEGKNYFWCACGRSKKQPFCDGSHKGSGITPLAYKATSDRTVFFCGCKQSSKRPICDGSHNRL